MNTYRKAIVAILTGTAGALGVAVSVSADNEFSLNDTMAIASAGVSALLGALGVYLVPNDPQP